MFKIDVLLLFRDNSFSLNSVRMISVVEIFGFLEEHTVLFRHQSKTTVAKYNTIKYGIIKSFSDSILLLAW